MRNVLLPTDFSDNSWNAIKYAIQLFDNEACTFYLLHVYTPIIYQVEYVQMYPAQFDIGDVIRDASQESLSKLQEKISKYFNNNPNHKFETISRFDILISGMKQVIEKQHIDLVVMGTKGATGATEILFGTNTVQVFREIKCPVMAIPSGFEFETPSEILFPTDLKVNYRQSQINLLNDIALSHHARINVVHVASNNELTVTQRENKLKLETMINGTAFLFYDIQNMDIPDAITEFQMKHRIKLLVMINNKHSFFENLFFKNTINQIGFHLNIPFLVMPS